MAYSFIAETDASSTNNTSVTTGAIDTTGANLIIIAVSHDSGATAPTDSKGNTWTSRSSAVASFRCQLYECVNPTVGSGHTFSITAGFPAIAVVVFSGAAAAPFDAQNSGTSVTDTVATGTVSPSEDNELVVTAMGANNNTVPSVDAPYSNNLTAARAGTANAYGIGMAYESQTTATVDGAMWTAGATGGNVAVIACFKAAAVAARGNFLTLLGVN